MRSTIVVTGAARGIGAAIAKQLLDQGYHVIGIDCQKSPEQWDISKTMTSDQSSQWQGISQDITHQQETQTLISELLEKYEITGLVNAAGVLIMRSMLEAKTEDWETLFAVNVMAP
ncbi:SDR family NAD(P)-dependent oxidoreductase, partial [Acinetobacter baumannii]|nr:SDR family NAD(P)-dependent oxidoreductase [Acinetobacter baumannii]